MAARRKPSASLSPHLWLLRRSCQGCGRGHSSALLNRYWAFVARSRALDLRQSLSHSLAGTTGSFYRVLQAAPFLRGCGASSGWLSKGTESPSSYRTQCGGCGVSMSKIWPAMGTGSMRARAASVPANRGCTGSENPNTTTQRLLYRKSLACQYVSEAKGTPKAKGGNPAAPVSDEHRTKHGPVFQVSTTRVKGAVHMIQLCCTCSL